MSSRPTPGFDVRRYGEKIEVYPLRNMVSPGITYSADFVEFSAAVGTGCDLYKWWSGDYSPRFKEWVIAGHAMMQSIKNHSQDAVDAAVEARNRRNANRGRG